MKISEVITGKPTNDNQSIWMDKGGSRFTGPMKHEEPTNFPEFPTMHIPWDDGANWDERTEKTLAHWPKVGWNMDMNISPSQAPDPRHRKHGVANDNRGYYLVNNSNRGSS